MKQLLAGIEKRRTYTIIMILSFIYGGFLLATYCFMSYSILWRGEVFGIPVFEGGPDMPILTGEQQQVVIGNKSVEEVIILNNETYNRTRVPPRHRQVDPARMLTSPLFLAILAGGLICIANGIAIRTLTHEKEMKQLNESLKKLYLTPEEKEMVDELERAGGEITQNELTERTQYSRVKTHRALQKLESKKIIQKIPYGQTNKIILLTEIKPKKG
jgi:uncharacterized membrane protein